MGTKNVGARYGAAAETGVLELVPPRTRWYCTRCRLIDVRDEPDPRPRSGAPNNVRTHLDTYGYLTSSGVGVPLSGVRVPALAAACSRSPPAR